MIYPDSSCPACRNHRASTCLHGRSRKQVEEIQAALCAGVLTVSASFACLLFLHTKRVPCPVITIHRCHRTGKCLQLARFEYPEKKEKPRRASVAARQCHDDATWQPGTSEIGLLGARNGCDVSAAARKPTRKRTPTAKADQSAGMAPRESSAVPARTVDAPVTASRIPEHPNNSKSPAKVKASKQPTETKVGRPAAESKAAKSSAEWKGNKGATAARAPKSPAGKSPVAKPPPSKSLAPKSPAGKATAGKAGAGKAPSKSAMVKALAGKAPAGKSPVGSPAGKSNTGRSTAGKLPAKGRVAKSPACDSDTPEKKCLKRTSAMAAAAATVAPAAPPSNAENAPSEAMKLWCRNVDRLTPGGTIHDSKASAATLKNQIMSDLMCMYFTLFRTDVSENLNIHYDLLPNITAHSGVNLNKPPPPSPHVSVAQLRESLATLRYTKHFVKDYGGQFPAVGRPVRSPLMSVHVDAKLAGIKQL